ncbi:MAG: histidine phosphatase family protein [Lachnospiraceae bacterium]
MKLIFIRHGEPDYAIDSLTPKGWKEADLLSNRVAHWDVTQFYCSPLGRAKDTASASLKKQNKEAIIYHWLQEFPCSIDDEMMQRTHKVPWDFYPEFLDNNRDLFYLEHWMENPVLAKGNVGKEYQYVCENFDHLLGEYGYIRDGYRYRTTPTAQKDATLVFFCHLGIGCALISHLINTTPSQLWQGFFLAPTSVTVLGTEERTSESAYFRCQVMGDTSHLRLHQEEVSYYGSFFTPFQG